MSDQPVYVELPNGTTEWTVIGNLIYNMKLYNPLKNTWTQISSIMLLTGHFSVFDVITSKQILSNGHTRIFNDYIANGVLLDKKLA